MSNNGMVSVPRADLEQALGENHRAAQGAKSRLRALLAAPDPLWNPHPVQVRLAALLILLAQSGVKVSGGIGGEPWAVEPVPPAGGEPEVVCYATRLNGGWKEVSFFREERFEVQSRHGVQVRELVDRAHVTRLQTDFDRRCDAILEELGGERDALQAELDALKAAQGEPSKGSGSLNFDGLLAEFHAAVWEAAADEDGKTDYDMAGVEIAKKLQAMFRANGAQPQGEPVAVVAVPRKTLDDTVASMLAAGLVPEATTLAMLATACEQPAPVAVVLPDPVGQVVEFGKGLKEVSWAKGKMPAIGSKLYTSATSLMLPARRTANDFQSKNAQYDCAGALADTWNACLDEVARLNTK